MRRQDKHAMDRRASRTLLEEARVIHLATLGEAGQPILRTLHGVLVHDAIAFHAAPIGEKVEGLGKQAVVSAEKIVASIPSYFIDPGTPALQGRACPATTYYQSVQVHGTLEEVEDLDFKAEVLQRLMDKYQPEGGYDPIAGTRGRYRNAVRGLLVAKLRLDQMQGKSKLGQNRKPEELTRVLQCLWDRGAAGDVEAIEMIRDANPSVKPPPFLLGPRGSYFSCVLRREDFPQIIKLVGSSYWNADASSTDILGAHERSTVWVGLRDESGSLVGTARALSDGVRRASIFDVAIAEELQTSGLGRELFRFLLSHPQMRKVAKLRLATKDAQGFYEQFGFRSPENDFPQMVLRRECLSALPER